MDLTVESNEDQTILSQWKMPNELVDYINSSFVRTVVKIYQSSNNILLRTIYVSNPYLNYQKINNINVDNSIKVCVNISMSNSTFFPWKVTKSYNTCIRYVNNEDEWAIPVGSSLAAFLILSLIVLVVFLVKRYGNQHNTKVMHKKSSKKRKPRNSYMFIYPISGNSGQPNMDSQKDGVKDQRKLSDSNSTAEYDVVATATLSSQGGNDDYMSNSESLPPHASSIEDDDVDDDDDLVENEDEFFNEDDENNEIIKCNCGLIHLVGTELECDSLLLQQQQQQHNQPATSSSQTNLDIQTQNPCRSTNI